MRKETEELMRERERIAKEREALMRGELPGQSTSSPSTSSTPSSSTLTKTMTSRLGPRVDEAEEGKWSDALDSVLHAVKGPAATQSKAKAKKVKPASIIPGASSFEDIEAYLDAEKKKKKDQMKQRNKDLIRNNSRW